MRPKQALQADCPGISVLIPVLNERENVPELHAQLTDVFREIGGEYEIVFVDDGSTDGTTEFVRELTRKDPHVVCVELRRKFGKATALQTGFQLVRGNIVITMDGDLQDDPKEIPRFLEALERGADLVSGWKRDRQDPLSKTAPSRLFNRVTSALTGIPLRDFNCGFKAYRREVVAALDLYGELHRYVPVLAHAKGFRIAELAVHHHPRKHGKSKYSIERFLRGAFDLVTVLFLGAFRNRPLHLFGLFGIIVTGAGMLIDAYLAVLWFLGDRPIGNRPLLMLGTLLILIGIQTLIFGLLAEMITAATYRRAGTLDLVRSVHRSGPQVDPSTQHRIGAVG